MYDVKALRPYLGNWLAFITLAALFLGPFYWPSSNSAWAGFMRASILIAVLALCWSGIRWRRPDALQLCALLFWGYMLANALLVSGDSQIVRRLVLLLCFVFMVSAVDLRSPQWPTLIAGIALLGAVFALFSLVNLYRLDQLSLVYRAANISSSGVTGVADFGNTIVAAMHYAVCLCAAVLLFFTARHRAALLFWGGAGATIGAYIILTYSRAGWTACLVSALVLAAVLYRPERRARFVIFFTGLLGGLSVFVLSYLSYEVSVRGVTSRDEIWYVVIERASANWLWGAGAGVGQEPISINAGQQIVSNTHSLYLEVFYQFGFVGLILMVAVLFGALWRLFRAARVDGAQEVVSFALALMVAAAVVMLVELNSFISTPNLVWLWFWLPLGVSLAVGRRADVAR